VAEPQSLRLRPHAAPAIAASLAISVTRPGMIAHRIDWQRGGSRIAFADSHGAPSHPYAQRSSSRSPTRCAIVALRPRMCRTLRSDKELTLRADSARSLATDVRPLPGAFLPFGQRSLSAQLRRPRPQSATSAKRRLRPSLGNGRPQDFHCKSVAIAPLAPYAPKAKIASERGEVPIRGSKPCH
jgi:hypothetical protein